MMSFRTSDRIYAHIDCNSFFASCEVLRNPNLKWKFVVVWDQICIACSYEAKKYGIKTGTAIWDAKRILGNRLIQILPDHHFYFDVSTRFMNYLENLIGDIEPFSVDEMFADITHIWDKFTQWNPKALAEKLKKDIYKDVWLPVSVWLANTRIKAKIFSDINKPFWSFIAFTKEDIENIYKKLPLRDIPYIGKWNAERLWIWVKTIYDFYSLRPMYVDEILWKNGFTLWLELHWVDAWRPINTKQRKSIICSRSFNHSMTNEYHVLWRQLIENLERAYNWIVSEKLQTRVVWVHLKDKEFNSYWEFKDLWESSIDIKKIITATKELFGQMYSKDKIYRTTWVQFSELTPYRPKQTSIFDIWSKNHIKDDRLSVTINRLKNIYGNDIIHRWLSRKNTEKKWIEILFEAR